MKIKRLIYILPVFIFIYLIYVFAQGLRHDPSVIPSALISKPAPDFMLPELPDYRMPTDTVSQNIIASRTLWSGKTSLINFFASWCVPCRSEHPVLTEIKGTTDLQMVGIAWKDKIADTKDFLRQLGNPFDIIVSDQENRVGIDWGVGGIPETYLVDAHGVIRYKHVGPISLDVWKHKVLPMLSEIQKEEISSGLERQ